MHNHTNTSCSLPAHFRSFLCVIIPHTDLHSY